MEECLRVMSEITPTLHLSSATAISDSSLAKNNITLIINASKELPIYPTKDAKILSVRVPVYDAADQNLFTYFFVSINHHNDRLLLRLKIHFGLAHLSIDKS